MDVTKTGRHEQRFAVAVGCLGFFGYEEVNAALTEPVGRHAPVS